MTSARRPVIIDTDLSFDDYVALLYLLRHPDIDVRAITVVNGTVHVQHGVENARRLMSFAGRPDIPVAGGPHQPLEGGHSFMALWRFQVDFGIRLVLPRVPSVPPGPSAPDLIRQQITATHSARTPITFVALGPLTNLALALVGAADQADPSLAARIDMVYISGGAINVPGTVHEDAPSASNRVAEWNFYVDPVAADMVFNSGARLALIPLDVTHIHGDRPLLFSRDLARRMSALARGRVPELMARIVRLWQLGRRKHQAVPVWDAAAAALVADPSIGSDWREMSIRVITQPEEAAGQTVVEPDQPANARVCLGGDLAAFEAAYLTAMQRS